MSDPNNVAKNLRERLGANSEDRLGRALTELLESPLLTGAIGRAFDARERASQAQEVALGALNIPSAADIERLTRRLRSVSHRLEGIEDGVDRLDRVLSPSAVEARLSAIEAQLRTIIEKLEQTLPAQSAAASAAPAGTGPAGAAKTTAPPKRAAPAKRAAPKRAPRAGKSAGAVKATQPAAGTTRKKAGAPGAGPSRGTR